MNRRPLPPNFEQIAGPVERVVRHIERMTGLIRVEVTDTRRASERLEGRIKAIDQHPATPLSKLKDAR